MNLFEDTYKTIKESAEGLFKDKGSKFIAYAYPFADEKDLKALLTAVKETHPKARHHCWAYRLTSDPRVFRLNDDGEPSGTAGRPILNALLAEDITQVLVVVVRYFGGTLLGVPGLIQAYKQATLDALAHATVIEKTVNDIYMLSFDYLQMNGVMRIIKEHDLLIRTQDFDNRCTMVVEIRQLIVNQVLAKISDLENVEAAYIKTV